jgi:hypothetical protein
VSSSGVTKLGNVTGLWAMSRATAARASSRPATAPSAVSTQLSVISWRSSRPRPAPTAVRTAISRRRVSDRAISRFATFAHTIAMVSSVTTEKIASIRSPFVATRLSPPAVAE